MSATKLTDLVLDALDASDSSVLRAVKDLFESGYVRIVDGVDPAIRRRRFFVAAAVR